MRCAKCRAVVPHFVVAAAELSLSQPRCRRHAARLNASGATVLVAFLRSALTDERVRWERAPFDHPGLVITTGQIGSERAVLFNPRTGAALDELLLSRSEGREMTF
jgi:hypothetical protein